MHIRNILATHPMGLGGAPIGNLYQALSDNDAQLTIEAAWEKGIRYFDTAPLYGYGLSELRMGKTLAQYPRHEFILSTKVGRLLIPESSPKRSEQFPGALPYQPVFDYSYDGIMKSYAASVERLVMTPDIILIHDIGKLTHGESNTEMMRAFVSSGYKAIEELRGKGIAVGMGVNETAVCLEVMQYTKLDFIMLAGRYTLLEQQSLRDFFPACAQQNIGVIIAGPYNSGILAGDNNNRHYNYQTASAEIQSRVDKLRQTCQQHHIELSRAAIQFPALHPQVVSVVTGARNPGEIIQSVDNFQRPVPAFFWSSLKQARLIADESPVARKTARPDNIKIIVAKV
jgi:D-threo-aldose 1-dehydrogenase